MADLHNRRNTMPAVSNMQLQSHAAMMNVGSNISGNGIVVSTRPAR